MNDSEKKPTEGQLIYADIGNSPSNLQHAAPASVPYPSLSLQLDDSQVQYADVKPHQIVIKNDNMVVDTELGTYLLCHYDSELQLNQHVQSKYNF